MCFFLLETRLIVLVNPIAIESVITRERQEFSPVLVRVTLCYTRNLQHFGGRDEYPWAIAGAGNRRCSRNKEIAAELKLSLRTIEGHISRILDKKNLSNRVELALHVRERRQTD